MDNKEINKMKMQLNNGITPSREDLEALLNNSQSISSSFIRNEAEHRDDLKAYIGSRINDYEILSYICRYIESQLSDLDIALNKNSSDKTYGYILDSIVVATKEFNITSKRITKQHSSITAIYTQYEFWDFSHEITDFISETTLWSDEIKKTVSLLKNAISAQDTFGIYKANEDLTALRSNCKFLKFWLDDNMPTQR